ncbi:MAG: tRNA lysidine(34) synthetase TilS [Novosphingobium sp.]|nr:tRNA lysidine(34) synthetase TilS [Novosphingobium sp.]
MALLRLVRDWRTALADEAPLVTVLTVDHGLREGSDKEARQVSGWSRSLSLPHDILQWTGPKPESGIQARARSARYDLMTEWCHQNGVGALLTAHTLDDQAETVLMRLARTRSIESLAGIPRHGQWKGIDLLRPLLALRRNDLRRYLQSLGQAWIEDPSNMDGRFERVRLRRLLPELADDGISAERLAALAADCASLASVLRGHVQRWIRAHVTEYDAGYCQFPAADFNAQPLRLRLQVLGRIIAHYGGSTPERGELERLAPIMAERPSRRTLGGALIWARGGDFMVGREPGRIDPAPVVVPSTGWILWDKRFKVTAPPGAAILPAGTTAYLRTDRSLPRSVRLAEPVVRLPDGRLGLAAEWADQGVLAQFVRITQV